LESCSREKEGRKETERVASDIIFLARRKRRPRAQKKAKNWGLADLTQRPTEKKKEKEGRAHAQSVCAGSREENVQGNF